MYELKQNQTNQTKSETESYKTFSWEKSWRPRTAGSTFTLHNIMTTKDSQPASTTKSLGLQFRTLLFPVFFPTKNYDGCLDEEGS